MNRLRSDILIYLVALVCFVGAVSIWWRGVWPAGDDKINISADAETVPVVDVGPDAPIDPGDPPASPSEIVIVVHVAGAVNRPGVYELSQGQRVHQAVELAGAKEDADLDLLNLAAVLRDSDKVYVPKKGEPVPGGGWAGLNLSAITTGTGGEVTPEVRYPININTAGVSELQALPGIGPSLANAIILYRMENGPYETNRDIIKVRGIGEKTYAKFAGLIVTK